MKRFKYLVKEYNLDNLNSYELKNYRAEGL